MPVEYIRQRLYSHSNLMSDSQTHEEANAADATMKRQIAAMDPEQAEAALKCAEERSSQNTRRMNEIDQEIALLMQQGAAAAAISDKAKVGRSPSPSENNRFMQRDYASPDFMRCKYPPPNSVSY
jgi:hypothetical protein